MSYYFDKLGRSISGSRWVELLNDDKYRIVKLTKLPTGDVVSTVWTGLDHYYVDRTKALIFETYVDFKDTEKIDESFKYATSAEAEAHHNVIVDNLMKGAKRSTVANRFHKLGEDL